MIIDLPLILTATGFFVISWAYGWGLLTFFRDKFAWDLASTIGIACVVCSAFTFVWMPRLYLGYDAPLKSAFTQVVFDLAIIFYAALPGMSKVRIELRKDAAKKDEEIARLRRKVQSQAEMMRSIESVINQTGRDSLDEIIKVLEMHNQGKYFCRDNAVKREGLRN